MVAKGRPHPGRRPGAGGGGLTRAPLARAVVERLLVASSSRPGLPAAAGSASFGLLQLARLGTRLAKVTFVEICRVARKSSTPS